LAPCLARSITIARPRFLAEPVTNAVFPFKLFIGYNAFAMIKTYKEAVKFLERYIPDPSKKYSGVLGLRRMQKLADLVGNPQWKYPTIHVGGTSGKGSTATIISSILGTKYRVGLNMSPHLVRINERIKINGEDISDRDFIDNLNFVIPALEEMERGEYGKPSHFEILTAMAFLYFYKKKVNIAVIEVGLGGRWDATNIIKPSVVVLTNVGLDHVQVLGETVEKIVGDKVGIIKKGVAVVSGVKQDSVIQIVKEKCEEKNVVLSLLNRDFSYKAKKIADEGSVFDYFGEETYKDMELTLIGEHQVENAAIAIRAIECSNVTMKQFSSKGRWAFGPNNERFYINEQNIREGLKKAFIPGRMEIVRRNPLIILDGAHNADKMRALVRSIRKIFPNKKIVSLVAIKNDKNAKDMLRFLVPISKSIIFTEFRMLKEQGMGIVSYKAKELEEMARSMDNKKNIFGDKNIKSAYEKVLLRVEKNDLILVSGSLYLVGEVRRIFNFQT